MRYKHIIWDFDGTLFDTYPAMAKAAQLALKELGYDESVERVMAEMKISMGHAMKVFGAKYDLPEGFMARYKVIRDACELQTAAPFAGIKPLCRRIIAEGGYNYIASHRGASMVPLLDKYGMTELFRACATDENGFARKPSPEAINYLIETCAIERSSAIMIGDRDLDLQAGENAGIDSRYFDGTDIDALIADIL